MGVSKNKGTWKWMVYSGKSYQNGWFGSTPIFGNTMKHPNRLCIIVIILILYIHIMQVWIHQDHLLILSNVTNPPPRQFPWGDRAAAFRAFWTMATQLGNTLNGSTVEGFRLSSTLVVNLGRNPNGNESSEPTIRFQVRKCLIQGG